jgi:predicted TIM-barrel fold metal-dependent hydrolase
MINVHTHIFNVRCAPNRFYNYPIGNFLSFVPQFGNLLATLLRKVNPFKNNDLLERYAAMISIGIMKHQKDIFEDLLKNYTLFNDVKVVALTMDMDFMGAGKAVDNFKTQIKAVADLKTIYPHNLIAFFGVDPRRPKVLDLLKIYVEDYGFTGIKLYPALGFFPFDYRMRDIYLYAIENSLPIITHCDQGGIFYKGPLTTEQLNPISLNPRKKVSYAKYKNLNAAEFKNFFTDPLNFQEVLEIDEFKDLKICFAHFGGKEMILGANGYYPYQQNWYKSIKTLIKLFPNIYTDISYTLHNNNKKLTKQFTVDFSDPDIMDKILFGTDYYMTVREKNEIKLINDFIENYRISDSLFHKLSVINNQSFLTTNFYNP